HSSRTSYAVAADLTKMELKKILIEKMEENKSIQRPDEQQNLYKALVDVYEADKTILESYKDTTIPKRRHGDDDDQEGPSAGSDRGSKIRREGGEPESASSPSEPATKSASRSITGTQSRQMSASEYAFAEEPMQTTCQMDEQPHPVFEIDAEDQPIIQTSQHPKCVQTWISELAKQADSRSSFNELLDTLIDFSNFIRNRLCIDTLTPKLLAGPTYELMRGSCNSLTELKYHLEEVYKATTDQLDWVNPEDYGYIKWIEDLVPHSMWIQEPLNYNKHALWGVSHWGQKCQQFYGFDVNRESALDSESPILTFEPVNSPIIKPVASPVSVPRPNQRPSIPYPSRMQDQKLRDKANDQREKFFQIFKDLNFNISFADTLILMPNNCPATDGNIYRDNIQEFVSQASAVNYNQGNTSYRPPMMSNQIRSPSFPPSKSLILTSEPVNSLTIEPVTSPVSAPRPNLRHSIPYPSRLQDQKLRDKANDQREKFFQIFKDLNFNIRFADALILMPKFIPSIKSLLTNTDKLCELARTPLNEHCLAVLLKKFPEKLGDPGKFLIPCDFPGKAECLALADLCASINLMPLFVWNKLSLPDLTHTCMTLELADRLISRLVGVAEDVYVKVGSFHFSVDFVVVDFDADPRTSRYSADYSDMTAKRIDVIDMACKEYSQEVLGFSDVIASVNPTPYYDTIVSTTSSTLTPFRNSDFLLEEVDDFLAIKDDPTSSEVDQLYLDPEGDILLLEAFLNDDPSLPPPNQGNYLPEVRKELKIYEAKSNKSSIDEPPEVELKDLSPHLEYAFLEGDDKFPVIIAKYLSVEEKIALIMVLKLHKRAIAWKLSDIKGIDLKFCTHKILMEEDFEPPVQHQRRVNPKIHNVIKQEVLKLLDAGLIYPISDSPWRCMMAIFHDMIEKTMKVFMDDFLVFGNYFQSCLSHLERMLKMCEDTNLCLNWEKSHFMVKEGIVLDQKISKQRIEVDKANVDVITKLPHPTSVKGAENLAADHLSRLENPHQNMLDPKETNESFPLETLNLVSTRGNSSTLWFDDFANYHAGNFVVKGMLSQQKSKFFKDAKHYFWDDPFCLKTVLIKSSKGVYIARKPLKFSRLATMDPPEDTMAQITQPRRFETPRAIISDRGTHFCNDQFAKVMQKFGVTHRLATSYHPQTSGQVEVSNRGLKPYKTPIRCTPYKLVYGKACHLPIELEHKAYWVLKHANFDLQTAGDHQKLQLNELNGLRDQAYGISLIYKEKTKKIHDSKIKNSIFNVSDWVLLFDSRLKIFSGKLKTRLTPKAEFYGGERWSGPFTITKVFPYGTVELSQPDGPNFKVNGHCVKHYFGVDVP
nr:reverse transcriptase domain-containing protein [Tanacetum cinerariifolium]